MIKITTAIAASGAAAIALADAAAGGSTRSVTLTPTKDNTLVQDDKPLSNGVGDSIYCGRLGDFGSGALRRAVLAFDVAAGVPAGSTIVNAALTLTLLQAASAEETHTLHRLLADWGEGQSSSFGGQGAPAEPGDATWTHTFYPDSYWSSAGGDFVAEASAGQTVGMLIEPVTWQSPAMAQDVQAWLDDPSGAFGWMLLGNEADVMTARRFVSKDNENPTAWPMLVIEFAPPCPADTNGSGTVDVEDMVNVILDWGCTGAGGCIGDVTGDGAVNVEDLVDVILSWGEC